MHGTPQRTTARTPYRAESTPPRAPLATLPRSPTRLKPTLEEYPESPTRSMRRVSDSDLREHLAKPKPLVYSTAGGSWRKPRVVRTARRAAICLVGLALVLFMAIRALSEAVGSGRSLKAVWAGEGDGLCRFVSPVEAYHRDLERLRRIYPHRIRPDTFPNISLVDHGVSNTTIEDHFFSPTGHLHVSPNASSPHPIPLLLALGEKRWEGLLANQSRTLPQAVKEYRRRYGRPPPRGFDIWWDFAMTHHLVLPDEYDRINLDLAPFFALPKEEMKRRMEMVEHMAETFTIVVKQGMVDIQILDQGGLKWDGTIPRAKDAASLLDVFARFLPDLKATFSIFDQPQIYLSWARRESLVNLGLHGDHTAHLHETDSAHVRLSRSCPPESNLRMNVSHPDVKSFIYDSLEAGDLCQNPYQVPLHGLTLEPHGHDSHPRPHTQLLPLFSLAKTSINSDILITPLDQFHDKPGKDPKWEHKTSSKLAWRGSTTGISMMTRDVDWRSSHRVRLHHFANNQSDATTSFLVPNLGQDIEGDELDTGLLSATHETAPANEIANFYYDMSLAGGPLQCSDGDGTCGDLWREIKFAGFQPSSDLNKHKFLLDIDGNGWSGRFRRLMSTNSLVIKASLFTEWFQPHLIPWFMYVPAKLDFSDLTDIMAFFRGTPQHPDLGFDETAEALARNGQCFARRMFRIEDLQAYMMRLFLEYARIVADEGIDMDFYLDEPSNPRDYELVEVESDETPFDDEDLPCVEDVIVNEGSPSGPLEGGEWVVDVLDNDQPLPSGRFGWEPEEKVEKEEPDWDGDNVPDAVGEERLNRFDYGDERSPTGGLPGGQEVFAAA